MITLIQGPGGLEDRETGERFCLTQIHTLADQPDGECLECGKPIENENQFYLCLAYGVNPGHGGESFCTDCIRVQD